MPDGDISGGSGIDIADYLHELKYLLGNHALSPGAIEQGDVAPLLNGVPDPDSALNTADEAAAGTGPWREGLGRCHTPNAGLVFMIELISLEKSDE